jgi:hypothetical protein
VAGTLIVERGLTETRVGGRVVPGAGDPGALATSVAREIESAASRLRPASGRAPSRIGLWIDRRSSAREGVALIETLGKKYQLGILMVQEPLASPRAELPPHVTQRLESIRAATSPARRSQMVADSVRDAMAGCGARERLPQNKEGTGPDLERRMHDAIVAAATTCSCVGVDLDILEALAGGEQPQVDIRPVRLNERSGTAVTLPDGATFQDLVQRLPPPPGEVAVHWTAAAPARAPK